MRMRKMKRKKYGNAEERAELLVRVGCLLFLLVMTRIYVAAGEPLPDAEQISLPGAEEMAEKTTVRIVLRPEKQEGEPDPDLTEEIRRQICAQVGEDPELAGRLCACVDWTYTYDDKILPPGETRGPGESDIFLTFADDPEYVFEGWTFPEAHTDQEESGETEEFADPDGFGEPGEYTEPEEFVELEEDAESDGFVESDGLVDSEEYAVSDESGEWEEYEDPESFAVYEENTEEELRSFLTTRPQEEDPAANEKETADNAPEEDGGPAAGNSPDGDGELPEEKAAEAGSGEEFHVEHVPEEEFHIKDEGEEETGEEETGVEQEVSVEYSSDEKNTAAEKYAAAYAVPQELTESFTELIREPEVAEEAEEAGMQTQVQLLRTDSGSREEDLTDMYREALSGTDPARLNWETLLAPLPENDGTYVLRTTETDKTGKENVQETAFSINRFGSVYTYNDVIQSLRGNTVKTVDRALVISEYNPDEVREDSREVALTLDGTPVRQVLYTVSRTADKETGRSGKDKDGQDRSGGNREVSPESNAEKTRKWNRYDYVIAADNFREDGVYSLTVSSRDTAGNASEMHRYNGGEIAFTVDGSPPELQAVQGLENDVVNGRKADIKVTAFDTVGLARLSAFVDGKLMATADSFADKHRAELTFSISQGPAQRVRIIAEDTAGNVLDTDEKNAQQEYRFRPAFPFNRQITVTPPPVADKPKPRGPAAILVLLVIACTGVSAFMLRRIFRSEKRIPARLLRETEAD